MPRLRQRTGTWCKQKAAAGVGQQAEAEEVAEEAGEAEAAVATEVAGEDENVLGEHLVLHRGSMIPKLKVTQLSSITSRTTLIKVEKCRGKTKLKNQKIQAKAVSATKND